MKIKTVLWGLATAALLVSCSGAKLSVANEQYARGEFYDAAQTYRKVYSKTNPRKERKLRGEIAFKMAECYRRINMVAFFTTYRVGVFFHCWAKLQPRIPFLARLLCGFVSK